MTRIRDELYHLHNFFNFCSDNGAGFDRIDSKLIDDYFTDDTAEITVHEGKALLIINLNKEI